jgi:enoyl-CoA hydratase
VVSPGGDRRLIGLDNRPDGVALLTLADPRRHNAIGLAMRDELVACVDQLRRQQSLRVLVVTGEGRSFCSGADLAEVLGDPALGVLELRRRFGSVYDSFLGIRDLPVPTIAAVSGHAIGAGLNMALSCDIRLAGRTARFGATFTRLGLHPGGGCTYLLTQTLGAQRAMSILLEGQTLSAEEAARLGLVLSIEDDALEAALSMAGRIAALPNGLARDIKAAVRLADEQGFAASLAHEQWAQAATATQPAIWEVLTRRQRPDTPPTGGS